MGYSLTIGNAIPVHSNEDGELIASWEVEGKSLEEAPAFPGDVMTKKSNGRYPGYGAWHEFCREVGLEELFFHDDYGLLRSHPGCFIIDEHHHLAVVAALGRRRKVSKLPPGYSDTPNQYDYNLARLIWLEWWMRWALANCETPALGNG